MITTKHMPRDQAWPIVAALLLVLAVALPTTSLIRQLDLRGSDLRAELSPRPATDRFVFLAIDKESIDYVGSWPWPRSVHAAIVDALAAANVKDIFLDIDFSTPSTSLEDNRLRDALSRADGAVLLPVFKQSQDVADPGTLSLSRPLKKFEDNAWLVGANISMAEDGRFRFVERRVSHNNERFDTAAVVLSNELESMRAEFGVDFSIRPDTIAVISVATLLQNKIKPERLAGKSVVVGAYAAELKDQFQTPIYGMVSGPLLHILAAETIVQGRQLFPLPAWPLPVLFIIGTIFGVKILREISLPVIISVALASVLMFEFAAYLLQKYWAIVVPTTTFHLVLVTALALLLVRRLGSSSWLLEIMNAENRNMRLILKRIVRDSSDALLITTVDGIVLEYSKTAAILFDNLGTLARGEHIGSATPTPLVDLVETAVKNSVRGGTFLPLQDELSFQRNGIPVHLEITVRVSCLEEPDKSVTVPVSKVVSITARDVTDRKIYESKLRRMSQVDDLTGVLNRREFIERVAQSWPSNPLIALVAIDIHRFSIINSTFGRRTGDQLLQAVAQRLLLSSSRISSTSSGAIVCRISGDVFCLAVTLDDRTQFESVPQDVVALFADDFEIEGAMINLDLRVGACLASDVGEDVARWVSAAELALDEAKKVGGSGWAVYRAGAADGYERRVRLEGDMREALRTAQFFLLYQPQVDLKSRELVGVEALVRWRHPKLGLVSPGEFIDIAEANGFICELGRWVLSQACLDAVDWPDGFSIAVNVSPVQFARSDIVADVADAIEASGIRHSCLHIEVTESTLVQDQTRLRGQFDALRSMGVAIALDDFGTGFSSMNSISNFSFDKLKIDQSFVRGVLSNPANQAIARSVISLAGGLSMTTVAEGIEHEGEWRFLAELGCQQGQGFYFGRPQSALEIAALFQLRAASSAV